MWLRLKIEGGILGLRGVAGALFGDVREVAVTDDFGVGVRLLEVFE